MMERLGILEGFYQWKEMLVKFNGSGQNQVTKTITVTANTSKGTETLRIKAFVTPKGAGPVGPVK